MGRQLLRENKQIYILILTLIKCFLILIIFGVLLPEIMDKLVNYFILKSKLDGSSYLVYNVIDGGKETIIRFIYFFRLSIR